MAEGKVDLWEINPLRTVDGECMICSGKGHGYGLIATVLDENDAKLIITAVNTYPSVEGLVKALEETLKFIESQMHYSQPSYDSGLEPSDQFTYDASPVACAAQDALSRFRSLQNGGAN